MSKLRSVIRHEYMTIVKQPSFWAIMIAIPVLVGGAIGLSILANASSDKRIEKLARDLKNVAIVDKSSLISKDVVRSAGLTLSDPDDTESLREAVRQEKKDALIVYPENLARTKNYQVYLSSNDFTKSSSVTSLADNLLETSIFLPLGSADIIALAQDGAQSKLTTYEHGTETAGINEYVVPGAFIVLFYIIFAFSVSYMLNSVGEEKENRSIEMVLTHINPRSLIVGKLLAVIGVSLTQVLFFVILGLLGLFVVNNLDGVQINIGLPAGIDFAKLVFDPVAIFFAASFLAVGFLMFAGFMTATAAIAPSMKEANSFSAVFYIGAFIPFYFITMLITDPENPVTKFVTFFPLTSPVVTLIRNAIGNMEVLEASLALVTMAVFMVISIAVAVRAFSLGALEFSNRVKLSSLLKK